MIFKFSTLTDIQNTTRTLSLRGSECFWDLRVEKLLLMPFLVTHHRTSWFFLELTSISRRFEKPPSERTVPSAWIALWHLTAS